MRIEIAGTMFRRAKLPLAALPPEVLRGAADTGTLVARVVMADGKGNPVCASLRPPFIEWSVGPRSSS